MLAASEPKDADIIWTSMQIDEEMKKAVGITDQQYINQFPFEACLVMKHHLADTIQKVEIANLFHNLMVTTGPCFQESIFLLIMILNCMLIFFHDNHVSSDTLKLDKKINSSLNRGQLTLNCLFFLCNRHKDLLDGCSLLIILKCIYLNLLVTIVCAREMGSTTYGS